MNSKQRRGQRVFVHEVKIQLNSTERLSEFDQRLSNAKGWLQWRTKRKNWTIVYNNSLGVTFKFRDGAMASIFALKFL